MKSILEFFYSMWSVLNTFEFKDLLDIAAVAFIIYYLFKLIKETRAVQLIKGIFILIVVYVVAFQFKFTMLSSLLRTFFEFSVIVLFIVFQPEVRRLLEQIGRSNITGKRLKLLNSDSTNEKEKKAREKLINAVVDSASLFSHSKTGALIVFEKDTKLGEIISTGTLVEANPSVALIGNLFFNKAPLHDGAVIIRDNLIYAAGCILPLTKNDSININLGTRHRAAIGVSEVSDAVVVVVSEETGTISIAYNGVLYRDFNCESLKQRLEELLYSTSTSNTKTGLFSFLRRSDK